MRSTAIVDGRLELVERPDPVPTGRQVLVSVRASGVNRADLLQRAGGYPAPPGAPDDVPGLELAGEVVAVGDRARGFTAGDRVMGLVGGGAHAELVLAEEDELVAIPERLDDVVAGATCEVFVTAHDALVTQAGVTSGETVLVHAVASGVGTAAVQLLRELGATSIGTTRSPDKLGRVAELGLGHGVVVDDPGAQEIVDELAGHAPAVVLDLVGGAYVPLDLRVTARRGRIVLVGLVAGARAEVPLGELMRRRISLTGTVLRSRAPHEKAAATDAFARQVVPLLAAGRLAPVIDETFPLERAQDAYDLLASNTTTGKVVLTT